MLDLVECAHNKLDDPIIMTWALRRYEYAKTRCPKLSRSMEEAWFDEPILRHWIEAGDGDILADLFRILTVRLFASLKPAILERWEAWRDTLAHWATPVLLDCPTDDVLALFACHVEENLQDSSKTLAVIEVLTRLPEPYGRDLLDDITNHVLELDDGNLTKQSLLRGLMGPMAVLKPAGLAPLVKMRLRAGCSDDSEFKRLLNAVCISICRSLVWLENAEQLAQGDGGLAFYTLQQLFADGAPLAECDRTLAEPEPWPEAKALLEKYSAASGTTETALSVIEVIQSLDVADDDALACFAIAVVLSTYERDDIDTGRFSMAEALDVLTLDLRDNRHLPQLTERLGTFDVDHVARAVNERMPVVLDGWGAINLARLSGELRLVGTVPLLIDCLNEESGGFLSEAAQDALARIGAPALSVVIARWDEFDFSQKIYGRGVLEQVGGEHACQFAVDRFGDLFRDDVESWCVLAEAAPDERLIELLAPEVRRKQNLIDETFYCLCVLTGRKHEDLKNVGARVMEERQCCLERRSAFAAGDLSHAMSDSVILALECEKCGDVNRYEVENIIVGAGEEGMGYFVGDEFPCASCGAWPDFEFTSDAHMGLMTAMLVHMQDIKDSEDSCAGPLRTVQVRYRWQKRPAPEVMAELKTAAAEHPGHIVNHLRLGRLHHVLERPHRADESYAQALKIDSDCMEAGLGMAQVLADTGEHQAAYDALSAMLGRNDKWRFFRVDELGPKGLADDFVQLYNKLQKTLGLPGRPLQQLSQLQEHRKVGRNTRCPCGSGTKYKKCCGNTLSAALH